MEGLDTITYWHRSGRLIPSILSMPSHAIASSGYVDAMSELTLNSRLPVGKEINILTNSNLRQQYWIVQDLEKASTLIADHSYEGLMMSPVSRH